MEFIADAAVSKGVCERAFRIWHQDEAVPGILWTPEDATGSRPLVLVGHGGGQHKRATNILALARRLVRHLGYAAAAIDAPDHGERVPEEVDLVRTIAEGRPVPDMYQAMLRALDEWKRTLDALRRLDGVGEGPTGYWGLSMGTAIGMPLVASEPRIDAAVLGLMGLPPGVKAEPPAALRCPVLFIVQWDDELVERGHAIRLYDEIASEHKTMHVNRGSHVAVPRHEIDASERFFAEHLGVGVPA